MMAIRTARHLTGRDIMSGKAACIDDMSVNVVMNNQSQKYCLYHESFFAGIALYLIALDSIGCLFDIKETASSRNNGIKRTLELFSSMDKALQSAVVDLRNTLAHNFGLATEKIYKGSPKKKKHKYIIDFSDSAEAIKVPTIEWDGDYDNKDDSSSTLIGLYSFCNLVEDVISKVYQYHKEGRLKLRISENEAKSRFTILT